MNNIDLSKAITFLDLVKISKVVDNQVEFLTQCFYRLNSSIEHNHEININDRVNKLWELSGKNTDDVIRAFWLASVTIIMPEFSTAQKTIKRKDLEIAIENYPWEKDINIFDKNIETLFFMLYLSLQFHTTPETIVATFHRIKYRPRQQVYLEYLETQHWKILRSSLLENNPSCEVCGEKDKNKLILHHKNYKSLWHETENDLRILCRKCHSKIHTVRDN